MSAALAGGFRAAIYCRLSKDDDQQGESASIANQRDIFGENGIPVRVSVSEMGPVLLSRLLGLTEVQQGVLNIVFRAAGDNDLLLKGLWVLYQKNKK